MLHIIIMTTTMRRRRLVDEVTLYSIFFSNAMMWYEMMTHNMQDYLGEKLEQKNL